MLYEQKREEALKAAVIPQNKAEDFDIFWESETDNLRKKPLTFTRTRLKTPYDKTFYTDLISFTTHDDIVVDAYFSCPNHAEGKLPCVVMFHGGHGSKQIMPDILVTGVCCFFMDVRSQGGTTVDKAHYTSGDRMGGIMTRGVLDKREFYMKNIYLDAVRAVDTAASLPEVDPARIVTYGGSQGGALSIAAAALSGKVRKCYTLVTSYCCLKERTELGSGVFDSTHAFLHKYPQHTDTVMETLSYFDILNLVSLLNTPTYFCLALSDAVCLPQFVYSAYAHTPCEKNIMPVPFAPHSMPEPFVLAALNEFAAL